MEFIFLGTGTSSGVPAIGCDCAVCRSTDPRDHRLRTAGAVRLTDEGGRPRVILLDAGPDLREQSLRAGLTRCDAIFFTHNHVDHTFGLDEVRRFNAVQRTPIDVYADDRTTEHLRRVYRHIFEKDDNVQESFVADLRGHRLTHDPVEVFGVRITPIPLQHGKLPILGFRVESIRGHAPGSPFPLAYCTDVSAIPDASRPLLGGLSTLVLDALRHRPHPTHFSLSQSLEEAGRIGARRTYFVHMSHDLAHDQTQRELPATVSLAYDGLVLAADRIS